MREKLTAILKQYWGYEQFRPMQYEVISSVLSGADTLALMPTGGGKSLTYQVPTLAMDGLCIVITPLIALMKDQVDGLRRRGISAVAVHSGLSNHKIDALLDNCAYGDVKFLYISPERISTPMFRIRVRRMNVALIAVDEAHCISEWGYDFRPAYRHIIQLRELLPETPVLALTASATSEVVDDIMNVLRFNEKRIFRGSFTRPNLRYVVRETDDKEGMIMNILGKVAGSGIIYTRRRRAAEQLAEWLVQQGVSASYYHGGLPNEERSIRQDEWVSGKVRVMVATNAFGMGIDKSDVRFVIHYSMSESIESYYQEAGRAGRDGERSYAVLLTQSRDYEQMNQRVENSFPPVEKVKKIYDQICSFLMVAHGDGKGCSYIFNVYEFCKVYNYFFQTEVIGALDILERNEYLAYVEESDSPARVIFCVGRDDLYKVEFSKRTEAIVTAMLRLYNGLFNEFRPIDEMVIATMCDCTAAEVHESLKELWMRKVIRYVPTNHSPIIRLLEERLPIADLYISPATYTRRKQQMFDRLESMSRYAENTTICRSVLIDQYFGGTESKECGCCDICLAKKREKKSVAVADMVLDVLGEGEFTVRQIVDKVAAPSESVIAALYALSEQGKVAINKNHTFSLLSDRGSEK